MARPSGLTPEVQARICDAIGIGAYQVEAARFAGVAENTLLGWLRAGRRDLAEGQEDTAHARFVAEYEQAEAKAVIRALTVVQRAAAEGDWRAAMGWLSRRHTQRWGERGQVDVQVTRVDPADIELAALIREAKARTAVEEEALRQGTQEGRADG
ncbi:hypothetical protein ACG83_10780 [Frankia sp. R43]|uniref:hypothetical protein n=1 Tax=Frankia sp. R43 TaxID=269536 RepID=UPI0006C9EB83|nr:hypothetical protein [Frankia sp. R43]KPM55753.1 hypothetical protein ACG83_10780 [Frankia sp. R43]